MGTYTALVDMQRRIESRHHRTIRRAQRAPDGFSEPLFEEKRDRKVRDNIRSAQLARLGITALAGVPVAVSTSLGVSVGWPIVGAASWALALLIKRSIGSCRSTSRPSSRHDLIGSAACQGAVSAAAELGCSALVFAVRHPAGPRQAIAFGAGAGGIEALFVLALSYTHTPDLKSVEQWRASRQQSLVVDQFVLIERALAMLSHIAVRGMLSTALSAPNGARSRRLLAAMALFTLGDSVAAYGKAARWNWLEPRAARRTHAFYAAAAAVESYLFWQWTARGTRSSPLARFRVRRKVCHPVSS